MNDSPINSEVRVEQIDHVELFVHTESPLTWCCARSTAAGDGAIPMIVKWLAAQGRHSRLIEIGFLLCFLALFSYALLDWLGWSPFEHGFQPQRMVLLSAALVLQSVAALFQRRSMILFCCLLALSMALLGATFAVTG